VNILRKIDNYLLHNLPSLWITRVHYFLTLGLLIFASLFFGNLLLGWNLKDDVPESETSIILLIIPVLIYLVYWFIFQSRYNVSKSGGRMTLGKEYLNYFLYMMVFFMAFFIILAIPLSTELKIKNSISKEELKRDIANLNRGNNIVNSTGQFYQINDNLFEMQEVEFFDPFFYDYNDMYFSDLDVEENPLRKYTREELLAIIQVYITTFNEYTYDMVTASPENILKDRINGTTEYSYYGNDLWTVNSKLTTIARAKDRSIFFNRDFNEWFWKTILAIIAWLSLLVWIFKQMNLRHFVFGFIAICLTPILIGIVGLILFEIFRFQGDEGGIIALTMVLITYFIVGLVVMKGYVAERLNNWSYVLTMYLHFFIPLIPLFFFLLILLSVDYDYWNRSQENLIFNIVYWISFFVGLISIAVFKPIYEKFRALPAKK
jgi:hypothetical protein